MSHSRSFGRLWRERSDRSISPVRIIITLAATLLIVGCSAPDTQQDPEVPFPKMAPDIAALVPESIREDGFLAAATDPNYPPMEFTSKDGGAVEGVDIDLVNGVAAVLGLTAQFESEAYTAISAGVRTGRFELGAASFTIEPEDQLRTNAVLYFESGTQLVRSKKAPTLTRTSMCGHSIASLEGSVQVRELTQESKDCRQRGYATIEIVAESTQAAITRAVAGGQADGMLVDVPVASLAVSENPATMELAGEPYDKAPLGMLTKAKPRDFTKAVRRAIQLLIDSGYYAHVLRTWQVSEGAVETASIRWSTP